MTQFLRSISLRVLSLNSLFPEFPTWGSEDTSGVTINITGHQTFNRKKETNYQMFDSFTPVKLSGKSS